MWQLVERKSNSQLVNKENFQEKLVGFGSDGEITTSTLDLTDESCGFGCLLSMVLVKNHGVEWNISVENPKQENQESDLIDQLTDLTDQLTHHMVYISVLRQPNINTTFIRMKLNICLYV